MENEIHGPDLRHYSRLKSRYRSLGEKRQRLVKELAQREIRRAKLVETAPGLRSLLPQLSTLIRSNLGYELIPPSPDCVIPHLQGRSQRKVSAASIPGGSSDELRVAFFESAESIFLGIGSGIRLDHLLQKLDPDRESLATFFVEPQRKNRLFIILLPQDHEECVRAIREEEKKIIELGERLTEVETERRGLEVNFNSCGLPLPDHRVDLDPGLPKPRIPLREPSFQTVPKSPENVSDPDVRLNRIVGLTEEVEEELLPPGVDISEPKPTSDLMASNEEEGESISPIHQRRGTGSFEQQRNLILAETYNEARTNKAEVTATKLDSMKWIVENDPLLKKWKEISYTGALKTKRKVVTSFFSTTAARRH